MSSCACREMLRKGGNDSRAPKLAWLGSHRTHGANRWSTSYELHQDATHTICCACCIPLWRGAVHTPLW